MAAESRNVDRNGMLLCVLIVLFFHVEEETTQRTLRYVKIKLELILCGRILRNRIVNYLIMYRSHLTLNPYLASLAYYVCLPFFCWSFSSSCLVF